jgi:hypothetical protein
MGDKATQETNYEHKTVSFVALSRERKEAEGLRKTMQACSERGHARLQVFETGMRCWFADQSGKSSN